MNNSKFLVLFLLMWALISTFLLIVAWASPVSPAWTEIRTRTNVVEVIKDAPMEKLPVTYTFWQFRCEDNPLFTAAPSDIVLPPPPDAEKEPRERDNIPEDLTDPVDPVTDPVDPTPVDPIPDPVDPIPDPDGKEQCDNGWGRGSGGASDRNENDCKINGKRRNKDEGEFTKGKDVVEDTSSQETNTQDTQQDNQDDADDAKAKGKGKGKGKDKGAK